MNHLDKLPGDVIDLIKYYTVAEEYFVVVQDNIIRDLAELTIYDVAYLLIINKANKTKLKEMCKPLKVKVDKVEYFTRINLMEARLNRKFELLDQVKCYWIRSGKGNKRERN